MKIIRGLYNLSCQFTQCVITLGNFDGIHLGHQSLILHLKRIGKKRNLPTVVVLFEPQPLEFFCADEPPARLTSFKEKCLQIQKLGVDYILVIPFNRTFASLSAEDFIEQELIKKLKTQYIVVGDDFRFGLNRLGNDALLKHYADLGYFELACLSTYMIGDLRVSSTAVRQALRANDFEQANKLLGRSYTIQGRVIKGNQLARQFGFPTVNIHLHRKNAVLHGVYYVKVKVLSQQQEYHGVANIGIRPTINGKKAILEVNIFDFNQDIYGQYLEIAFIQKIRDERKFDSLAGLQTQISKDVCIAKTLITKS